MNRISIVLWMVFSVITGNLFAQEGINEKDYTNYSVEMADGMRASGKIYVVVIIIMILIAGLFLYLWKTEQKLKKIEKAIK
jgi:hypothetical protein